MIGDICRCGSKRSAMIGRRQALTAALGAAGVFASFSDEAFAVARQMAPLPEDEGFMRMALAEAARGDFPFGAVLVREGAVLASGRNLGKANNDPTAHCEMVAIRNLSESAGLQSFPGRRSILRGSLARCAWVQFYGAGSAGWSLQPR